MREAALKDNRRLCFLALRHTFQTEGAKSRDKDAVRAIMGHAPLASDMSAEYDEDRVDDARLRAVANHVLSWLRPRKSQSRSAAA
jgi:integrase